MFTFDTSIPENIRGFLSPLLGPWIEQGLSPYFSLDTTRYGLVTFRRDPWPPYGDVVLVMPMGEVDLAAVQAYSQEVASGVA